MAREFDFIIVGAGSVGCVLTNRLSENGRFSVLLIEAGGSDRKLQIRVPIGYGFTYADSRVNWKYSAEPDPGLKYRVGYWPRGKVIGGSSSINAMVYCRGLPEDFNDWVVSGGVAGSRYARSSKPTKRRPSIATAATRPVAKDRCR